MIRAPFGEKDYWDKWVRFGASSLQEQFRVLETPSGNPVYDPQYSFDLSKEHLAHILRCYSRGDPIQNLGQHFEGLLNAWELSNRLAAGICVQHDLRTCRDWTFDLADLDHYIWCFWLVGLALVLNIEDRQWTRLLNLIGAEGEDALLDRIVAARQPKRQIGSTLLHAKPYARLLRAIQAPSVEQAQALKDFVGHWYSELNRRGKQQPYWYNYHNSMRGAYFGYWCVEAVAAVKVFCLDDGLCLGHEHYPGDLLRPDQPSTHAPHVISDKGWLSKIFRKRG